MSRENTLTLNPHEHDKLGVVHCGVTREGFIAVAGDPYNIDDGEQITFDRVNVEARRNGSEYIFKQLN